MKAEMNTDMLDKFNHNVAEPLKQKPLKFINVFCILTRDSINFQRQMPHVAACVYSWQFTRPCSCQPRFRIIENEATYMAVAKGITRFHPIASSVETTFNYICSNTTGQA
jgi:hypothetical protein